MAPVKLDGEDGAPQPLPEGLFRVVDGTHARYRQLQLQAKGEWRGLYEWRDERAPLVDQARTVVLSISIYTIVDQARTVVFVLRMCIYFSRPGAYCSITN
jgi:arylamine N-acetyltransferase